MSCWQESFFLKEPTVRNSIGKSSPETCRRSRRFIQESERVGPRSFALCWRKNLPIAIPPHKRCLRIFENSITASSWTGSVSKLHNLLFHAALFFGGFWVKSKSSGSNEGLTAAPAVKFSLTPLCSFVVIAGPQLSPTVSHHRWLLPAEAL